MGGGILPSDKIKMASSVIESTEIDFTNLSNDIDEDLDDKSEDFIDGTGLITKEMIEEEKKMHQKTLEEEQILKEKAAADKEKSEQCYKRLQHLLSRSNFYTQFLIKKIEEQLEQKKKAEEKAAAMQKERPKLKELSVQLGDPVVNRQTRSAQQEPKSSQGSDSEPNRKRKLEDSTKKAYAKKAKNLKIVDIVDKESLAQCAGSSKSNEKSNESSSVDNYSRTIGNVRVSDKQPELFVGGVMRDYQLEGLEWMKVLYENGVNGILGDEMGLGKTIQCIALIAHLVKMGCPGPFLICAPLSTLPNWFSEFQRFTPKIPAVLYHGNPSERRNLRKAVDKKKNVEGHLVHPIVISSYEVVMKDRKYFAKYEWRYIIIDEGHRIKNFKCKLVSELKKYRSVNRLLLTGTPLQNSLSELWSLLNFLLPEIFDELEVFESWFNIRSLATEDEDEKIIEQEKEKEVIATIHQILSPFMLRRTKKDVELNLNVMYLFTRCDDSKMLGLTLS